MDYSVAIRSVTRALHGPYDYPVLEYEHEQPGVTLVIGYRHLDAQECIELLEGCKYTFEAVYSTPTRTRLGVPPVRVDDAAMKTPATTQAGPLPLRIYPQGHRIPPEPNSARQFSSNPNNAADVKTKWPRDAPGILAVLDTLGANVPEEAGKQTTIETNGTTIDIKIAIDHDIPGAVFEQLFARAGEDKIPLTKVILTHNHVVVRLVAHNTAPSSASEMRRQKRRKAAAPY